MLTNYNLFACNTYTYITLFCNHGQSCLLHRTVILAYTILYFTALSVKHSSAPSISLGSRSWKGPLFCGFCMCV